jgi:copper chaperone
MAQLTVTAPDISCGHCKMTIESELAQSPGVRSVDVDVDTRNVRVDYDESATSEGALRSQLEEIGYPAA